MKKLMLAVLVGLMVIASASIAAAEITVGGEIETRYDMWYNLDLNRGFNEDHSRTQTQNFFADRVLLNVDAKITEGLEAFVELDTNGTDGVRDEQVWGFNGANGNFVSPMNYQGNLVAIRQAWVNFMLPGLPVGAKIGHQPLALGHGIFLDSHRLGQDAILVYAKPIDPLLLAGVYVKSFEGSTSAANGPSAFFGQFPSNLAGTEHNDVDVYAALANFTWAPNNTVGVNYLYGHNAMTLQGAQAGGTEQNPLGLGVTGVLRIHNIGVNADGAFGPLTYKAEVDFQHQDGSIEGGHVSLNNAWAGMVGVGAKVAIVNVGAEVAYGTGTSPNRLGNSVLAIVTDNPLNGNRTYFNPYGTTSYNYAFLYNDKIGQGPLGTNGGLGLGDGTGGFGLANTGYVKLTAGVNPTDRLGIDLAALYLRASEPYFNGQSRDLGWEIDAHAGYKIYDNLNLDVTGGVFVPGAWYAYQGVTKNLAGDRGGLTDENDPDSPFKRNPAYGLETKLTVKF